MATGQERKAITSFDHHHQNTRTLHQQHIDNERTWSQQQHWTSWAPHIFIVNTHTHTHTQTDIDHYTFNLKPHCRPICSSYQWLHLSSCFWEEEQEQEQSTQCCNLQSFRMKKLASVSCQLLLLQPPSPSAIGPYLPSFYFFLFFFKLILFSSVELSYCLTATFKTCKKLIRCKRRKLAGLVW